MLRTKPIQQVYEVCVSHKYSNLVVRSGLVSYRKKNGEEVNFFQLLEFLDSIRSTHEQIAS